MKVIIGRPINGISINGLEYVCDKDGFTIVFESEEKAKSFLHINGVTDKDIEMAGIIFEEYEEAEDNV